ncbi:extracellular exonuclease ExeM [Shewanella amazonensis]|uniref:Extracellular nuclease n=1 Tax=Shewanella amazonensis (strain ATCC BAA-1098 / SB2B) TaxID=326297 RepID=A1S9U1_SHEAM|nr:extracellular exonuclease ExeM [Shewanella amazonensis]ABM01148.1 extracellular nuclease [Shewanella amazonensis SB2B]
MENVKKLTAIAVAVSAAMPLLANADVMITEYVEGSSNNKAIELYNSGDAAVDLTGYTLARYKDGATTPSNMVALDGQSLAAKGIKVITHPSAVITLPAGTDTMTGDLYFNGTDAVALMKDGAIVDVVGAIPTPKDWGLNVTIARKTSALAAATVYNEADWETSAIDNFSGLGSLEGTTAPEVPAFSCAGDTLIPIYDIQGSGDKSPLVPEGKFESDTEVTLRGVVSARGESLFKGFYLQDVQGDNSPLTSDGIFVFLGEAAPEAIQPGVEVCVQGKVKEYFGLTQIDIKADKKFEVGAKGDVPAAAAFAVTEGESLEQALERFEGMKVVLDAGSEMKVSRTFSYDYAGRRNNLMLSHKAPLMKPTQVYPALSEEAVALEKQNRGNELFVESDFKAADGVVPFLPDFNAETGYIRVGDELKGLEGMVSYSYNEYRLVTTNTITPADIVRGMDRTDAPVVAEKGDIRVASFNVLNFFNDVVGGDANPTGSNRGALTEEEMLLQRTKIVNAITAMNADIVGLMEIANNGFGEKSAIQNLLDALNAEQSADNAYSFVEIAEADKTDGKYFGNDAITVGMLYRAAKVSPEGTAFVIETPEQHAPEGVASRDNKGTVETSPAQDKYQRHSLGQTFKVKDENLTVVVNHLKSKGSGCLEDWINFDESRDPADLQGKCNAFRVSAAKVIGEAVKDIEGDVLVIGDLNAYGMEDPVRVLTDYDATTSNRKVKTASYTTLAGQSYEQQGSVIEKGYGLINLNTQVHGADTYSYSYNGELGNLDHALGNESLAKRVVDIEDWHINSVESNLFEYGKKFTGSLEKSENAFSASDHDPVIVALSYPDKVEEKKDDGGAMGGLLLALATLIGLGRRRIH